MIEKFGLDDVQAQAILEMKLRRLTGLAREDIEKHLDELHKTIDELRSILASEAKVMSIIKDEMSEIKRKYADDRRTTIDMTAIDYIEDESLIPEENVIISLTEKGYIKRVPSSTYKTQNRGGVGIKGMTTNEDDKVEHLINLSTHDYVLFFSNKGRVYRLKGYEIPEYSRQGKGLPIVNLLQIDKDEFICSMLKISTNDDIKYLAFATKSGIIKRTLISEFENIRNSGKIAITLKDNDELLSVKPTKGDDMIMMASDAGRMVKFKEDNVRVMGRTAAGVRGINLADSKCISLVRDDDLILIVTEKGYGKKSRVNDYRETNRGSKGVKAINITEKNGHIVAVKLIYGNPDAIIMTDSGMTMRMSLDQVSVLGRATQGVRLINLKDNQKWDQEEQNHPYIR